MKVCVYSINIYIDYERVWLNIIIIDVSDGVIRTRLLGVCISPSHVVFVLHLNDLEGPEERWSYDNNNNDDVNDDDDDVRSDQKMEMMKMIDQPIHYVMSCDVDMYVLTIVREVKNDGEDIE